MQTLRAMALIETAVQLADAQFPGDALQEACRFASREERLAVLCIVQSRPTLFGQPATPQQVITALREMVRGEPAPDVLGNTGMLQLSSRSILHMAPHQGHSPKDG